MSTNNLKNVHQGKAETQFTLWKYHMRQNYRHNLKKYNMLGREIEFTYELLAVIDLENAFWNVNEEKDSCVLQ